MKTHRSTPPGILAALLASLAAAAGAEDLGDTVVQRGVMPQDFYIAGRGVELQGEVQGDAVAAGKTLTIGGKVTEDLIAAGESVLITAEVGDDVRVAGRSVTLSGSVDDHLVAAGETVKLDSASRVNGRAWLAGRRIWIMGPVGGPLQATGQTITLGGEIRGDVELAAQRVDLLPEAHITGNLRYTGQNRPYLAEGARIDGSIIARPMPEFGRSFPSGAFATVLLGASLALAAIVYHLLLPHFSLSAARLVAASPLRSLGVGVLVFLVTPLLAVLLMASVIGWVLGWMLLMAYLVWLCTGFYTGVHFVADRGITLVGRRQTAGGGLRALAIIAALFVLAVLQLLPVVGPLLLGVLFLLGLGAVSLELGRAYLPDGE